MKFIHIAIIAGACVVAAVTLFLVIYVTTTQSNVHQYAPAGQSVMSNPQTVQIENVTTEPETVVIGNSFHFYATVKNSNPWPIYFTDACSSPLSALFDKNIVIQHGISCMAISNETIGPGQETLVHGPNVGTIYNASSLGNTSAMVTFSYEAGGMPGNVTVSKNFIVETPSPSSSGINQIKLDCSKPIGMQMAQIDKSVDVQKAISLAYTSPEFMSEVNQYGTVTYNSFFNNWLTGDPCNTIWKGIEMVFSTTDKNGLARNIQVTEDINLTRVLNVTDYASGFSK